MLGKNKSIVYFGRVWFIIINLLNDIVLKRKKKDTDELIYKTSIVTDVENKLTVYQGRGREG